MTSPFRWAGGKRWLLPILDDLIGNKEFGTYHEPFLGGGSVFLGLSMFNDAILSDSNAELIEAFEAIRDSPDEVAELAHANENDEATYYRLRSSAPEGKVERAARFLYMNHTSFNGIYRVNLDGIYNVPYGRRDVVRIPDAAQLADVSDRLQRATLLIRDFGVSSRRVRSGDLVFLDPPYTVAHNNNGFVKYNQQLFSFQDQRRLSQLVDRVKAKGAYYILTNAAHESIATLFEKGDCRMTTRRRNNIGGVNAERGGATEYLFTNLV